MPGSTTSPQASARFHLVLPDIGGLFIAPAVNPFAAGACEILGRTGVDYLHACVKEHWPRSPQFAQIALHIPATTLPGEPAALERLTAQTQSALQRYCAEEETAARDARKLTVRTALRQTFWALLLTGLAIAFAVAVANGWPEILSPFVRGVFAVLFLLAASLAIWDALDALLFQWVPIVIDSGAYRALARMQIVIEADPAQEH